MKWLYIIENSKSDKCYIGVTIDPKRRWRQHVTGNTQCIALRSAMNKYGVDNFTFRLLCCGDADYIDKLEVAAIKRYGTQSPAGYNITAGGDGASFVEWESSWNSLLGVKQDSTISKQLGVSAGIIASRRSALGIPRYSKLSRVLPDLIKDLGTDTDKVLSLRYGVSPSTIENYRRKHGVSSFHPCHKRYSFPEDKVYMLGSMLDKHVAKELELPISCVRNKRNKLGVAKYKIKRGEGWKFVTPTPDQEVIIKDTSISIGEAADKANLKFTTVAKRRKELGIKYVAPKGDASGWVVWDKFLTDALVSWEGRLVDFAKEFNIPQQATYNKVKKLKDKGLL